MDMLLKAIKMIFQKKNLDVLIFLVACHIGVVFGSWWFTKPHFDSKPCRICGRADTKPKATLYQYKVENGVPYMKEKDVYYCDHHYQDAPRIVKDLSDESDTIPKRLLFSVVLSTVLLFLIVFSSAVLEIDFNYLLAFPPLLGGFFWIFGPSSDVVTTALVILIFLAPFGIFWLWLKYATKRIY
ncbi:MAG: hypothetical protein K9M80_05190 [Candidatus Marinimicrobia bacterium]|nr:hypothetical protein [Candidatus Neomarinimicrobiota bacterium]